MLAAPAVPGVSQADWGQRLFAALAAPSGPLAPVQQRGLDSLAQRSMPERRDEAWRFTDLAALTALDPAGLLAAPAAAKSSRVRRNSAFISSALSRSSGFGFVARKASICCGKSLRSRL